MYPVKEKLVQEKEQLFEFMSGFVTERRKELITNISAIRTNYITLGLEDIYQSQNASAVLRTADCFGLTDVHIIENKNEYKLNPDVELGASKWLTLNKYNQKKENTVDAINTLKTQGYRIVATTPHTNDVALDEFDLAKGKVALLFGTELNGLTDIALEHSDEFLKIPMHGFTESFNISVSAAIIMHHLTLKLRQSDLAWQLTDEEQLDLRIHWIRKSFKNAQAVENKFFNEIKAGL